MSKKQLAINDVGESGFKILEALTDWMMVSQIAIKTGLGNTTIRRLVQRLEAFGLVQEELRYWDKNPNVSSKHFNLTKEGRVFVKRIAKTQQQVSETFIEPQKPAVDIVIWLRQKAQEFNAMADDLSVYED